jgi:two-component system LytT family sensor kinase
VRQAVAGTRRISLNLPVMATVLPAVPAVPAVNPLERLLHNREASFWALQGFGWSAYFIAQYVSALFYPEKLGPDKLTAYVCVLVVAAATGFVLSSLLRYAYRRIRDRPLAQVAVIALTLMYAAALVWRVFINGAYIVFMGEQEMFSGAARIFAGALISTYLLMAWTALYFGIYFYEAAQRERMATLRAMALAQEAQVKMLRYQLNPHFLFNTLNAISTLILDRDNATANLAVTRLSAFLRHTLDQDPMKKVTLGQELEALDLYLGIEKLRFGPRLRLARDVDPAALAALVPSLLLQPLVENALKYAIAPSETGGTLHVGARLIGARLLLHVADDGPGLADPALFADGRGVGLRNTRERLAVLYGARARFVGIDTGAGLRIDLEIPAEYAS